MSNSAHPFRSTTHEERFYHLDGECLDENINRKVTLFARKEGHLWRGAIAICHAKDVFSRRRGRTVARRKYFAEPAKAAIIGEEISFEAVLDFAGGMLERQLPQAATRK